MPRCLLYSYFPKHFPPLSVISVSHNFVFCVEKCLEGMLKKELNKFCDLVRGTASTEEFKISGSKESSGASLLCMYKSMNVSKKVKSKMLGGNAKFPLCCWWWNCLPCVPCAGTGHSSPEWEYVTSWKCSFQAKGVQDVQAVPVALKGLCSGNLIFAESFFC